MNLAFPRTKSIVGIDDPERADGYQIQGTKRYLTIAWYSE
jgi:hypothetical protein